MYVVRVQNNETHVLEQKYNLPSRVLQLQHCLIWRTCVHAARIRCLLANIDKVIDVIIIYPITSKEYSCQEEVSMRACDDAILRAHAPEWS